MVSGDGLARVTYLPGITPPPSPETAVAQKPAPDFATFFGDQTEAGTGEAGTEEAGTEEGDAETTDRESTDCETTAQETRASGRREVRAENVSMHALTRRGMSRWELEKTLLSREFDAESVEAELERLEGVGLIDDAELAENFARTQHERKGLGRGAITAELRRRHVDQEHIDAALEQIDDDDEQERATELAVKRAAQLHSYDLETAKRRLHGFLSRKGYSSSVVRTAIDEALSARSSGVRFR